MRASGPSGDLSKTYFNAPMPARKAKTASNLPDFTDPDIRDLIKRRFLRWAEREAGDGEPVLWRRVSDTLEKFTGQRVKPETLRKNFRAASAKQGKPPNQFRDPRVWCSLYDFLTSDAVRYLTAAELPNGPFAYAAFAGVQQFIDPSGRSSFPKHLLGRFDNYSGGEEPELPICVDIFGPASPEPMRIELREYKDGDQRDEGASPTGSYSGGVLYRADGHALAILKEVVNGRTRTFFLLNTHPQIQVQETVVSITLLHMEALASQSFFLAENGESHRYVRITANLAVSAGKSVLAATIFLTRS